MITEDGVLPVEPLRRRQRDEELRPVRVWPRVCHGEDSCAGVLQLGVDLVLERLAVDGGAAAPRARGVAACKIEESIVFLSISEANEEEREVENVDKIAPLTTRKSKDSK